MSAEENKATFRRYVEEVVNQGNLELADEIFDRYLAHQPDGSVLERGPEDVKRFLGEFHAAFPDFNAIIEDQIAEGDRVMTRYRWRGIQQALLPKEVPTLEGWEVTSYYQPAKEVGGDFYDFLELPDGRLGLVVGDATGHGVPAALMMANTQSVLRAVAQRGGSEPGRILAEVNEVLLAYIPPSMFVTCFYAILDPKSGTVRYANAGHDLPYLWHGCDCEELRARGMPLGLMPGMSYEEKEMVLDTGEGVLFYSDGLVEAHDPEGEMFGFPRLRELVAEHDEERSLEEALLEELYSFVGEGWEQEDDITLLMLKRSASLS